MSLTGHRTNQITILYSRIFYHCWPASKRILQSSPHSFLPQGVLDLLGLLIFFLFFFAWLASLEDFLLSPAPFRSLFACHFSQYLKSL